MYMALQRYGSICEHTGKEKQTLALEKKQKILDIYMTEDKLD